MIKRLPKRRGRGKHSEKGFGRRPVIVSITTIARLFKSGETVSPVELKNKGLIKQESGYLPKVKILNDGKQLTVPLLISGCLMSKSVREKIIKAGGSVTETRNP